MQPSFQVLVACSANVCRSPLAASVIRSGVAGLGSTIYVSWAGTYAAVGDAMCPQAAAFAGNAFAFGSSRQIDLPLLANTDLLLTADRSQRAWLARMDPSRRSQTFTLRQGARLATSITEKLMQGIRPAGSAALPELAPDRLRWLVTEMDAARGAHASWDPFEDDIEDMHSDEDHRATLEAVARVAGELANAFVVVATVDSASLRMDDSPDPQAQPPSWEGAGSADAGWLSRLPGKRVVRSAADLQSWVPADFLGEINSSTPTFSHILVTPHLEIAHHLQRALAHADVHTSTSFPAIVLLTSAREGSGKTATAINLATCFAQMGRSVVLVDADLRTSKISAYLGIEPEVGLPDVLAGVVPVEQALLTWHRGLINLLPCGPRIPDPGSLMASEQYQLVLKELKSQFDVVIVNAPPVNDWPDTLLLTQAADGTVLVAGRSRTSQRDAKLAAKTLHAYKANVLGTILTVAPSSH